MVFAYLSVSSLPNTNHTPYGSSSLLGNFVTPNIYFSLCVIFLCPSKVQHSLKYVLRQVPTFFQSKIFTECHLLFYVSVSSNAVVSLRSSSGCLRLLPRPPVTYLFCHLSFNNIFQKAVPTHCVTNPIIFPPFCCLYDIPLFLHSLQHFFTSHTIGPTHLHPSPAPHFRTFQCVVCLPSSMFIILSLHNSTYTCYTEVKQPSEKNNHSEDKGNIFVETSELNKVNFMLWKPNQDDH